MLTIIIIWEFGYFVQGTQKEWMTYTWRVPIISSSIIEEEFGLWNFLRFGESLNDNVNFDYVNECRTQNGSITDGHSHSDTVTNAVTRMHTCTHTHTRAHTLYGITLCMLICYFLSIVHLRCVRFTRVPIVSRISVYFRRLAGWFIQYKNIMLYNVVYIHEQGTEYIIYKDNTRNCTHLGRQYATNMFILVLESSNTILNNQYWLPAFNIGWFC